MRWLLSSVVLLVSAAGTTSSNALVTVKVKESRRHNQLTCHFQLSNRSYGLIEVFGVGMPPAGPYSFSVPPLNDPKITGRADFVPSPPGWTATLAQRDERYGVQWETVETGDPGPALTSGETITFSLTFPTDAEISCRGVPWLARNKPLPRNYMGTTP